MNLIIPVSEHVEINLSIQTFLQHVIKGPYADHILIPRAQPEVVLFLVSNESPYFSHYNRKISASNSLYFGSL